FSSIASLAIYPRSLHDALPIYLGDVDPAMYFHSFDANAEFAVWTQARADPRFESLGYSVIMRRDHNGGEARALTRRSRLFGPSIDRKSTRLNSSHVKISYAVFC